MSSMFAYQQSRKINHFLCILDIFYLFYSKEDKSAFIVTDFFFIGAEYFPLWRLWSGSIVSTGQSNCTCCFAKILYYLYYWTQGEQTLPLWGFSLSSFCTARWSSCKILSHTLLHSGDGQRCWSWLCMYYWLKDMGGFTGCSKSEGRGKLHPKEQI